MENVEYPCHSKNINHKYYKGTKSVENGECKRCEWSKWMGGFIEYLGTQDRHYALEICIDVEDSSDPQPEAIFIDLENKREKMVLEIKDLREAYSNKHESQVRNYIQNNFINDIAKKIIIREEDFLEKYESDDIYVDFLKQGDIKK